MKTMTRTTRTSPGVGDALARARARAAEGDLSGALAALDEVLANRPEDLSTLVAKGTLLLEARRDEDALLVHRRAVDVEPRSSEALCALARCLHALGRHEEALGVAEEACRFLEEGENFRQAGPVYLTMAWCLRDLRRPADALRVAEAGLRRTPDALLAEWASVLEAELAAAEREGC
jgi:tetratricopeptide (TPR) repeat protein